MTNFTKVLIMSTPCTVRELEDFIFEANRMTDADPGARIKIVGKDIRVVWPPDSHVADDMRKAGSGPISNSKNNWPGSLAGGE